MRSYISFERRILMKKLLAILLCVSLMLSMTVMTAVAEDEAVTFWDGETYTEPQGSGSSEADPYIVSTPAELAWMVNVGGNGRYFKLANDIYVNDVAAENWTETAKPWFVNADDWQTYKNSEGQKKTFAGHVDGAGHTVYGIYCDGSIGTVNNALIPIMSGGSIKRLCVSDAVCNSRFSGGIVGTITGSIEISDCVVKASVISNASSNSSSKSSGGIAGYATSNKVVTITRCATFDNTYDASGVAGGILGNVWNATVTADSCYTDVAKLHGGTASFTPVNSCAKEGATVDALKTDSYFMNCAKNFVTVEGFDLPVSKVFAGVNANIWNGFYQKPVADENGNYLITCPEELAWVVGTFGGAANTYVITNDLYLNDVSKADWMTDSPKEWFIGSGGWNNGYDGISTTRGYFSGTIDGNGHFIYGLYNSDTNSAASMAGLIPGAGNATVKNLAVSNASVTEARCGGIVGVTNAGTTLTLDNCYATSSVAASGTNEVGGLVGYVPGTATVVIKNCVSETSSVKAGLLGGAYNAKVTVSDSISYSMTPFGGLTGTTAANLTVSDVYTDASSTVSRVTVLTADKMKGDNAKIFMQGLSSAFVIRENAGPMLKTFTEAEGTDFPIYEGEGTEASPYLISTPEELYYCVAGFGQGKFYKLTNNIDLAEFCEKNGGWIKGNAWTVGYGVLDGINGYFSGTLDGDGYTVSGLNYAKSNTSVTSGLIPLTKGDVTVKNLRIAKSYITAEDASFGRAGAVIGFANNSNVTIENCIISSDVTVWGRGGFSGGLIGYNNGSATVNIRNCAVLASYRFTDFIASGITVNITDSYVLGNTPYAQNNGTVVTTNVYTSSDFEAEGVTVLEKAEMVGADALTGMSGLSSELWYATSKTGPMLSDIGNKMGDVNKDGVAADSDDLAAIRLSIIAGAAFDFADRNEDTDVDIFDLVLFGKAL